MRFANPEAFRLLWLLPILVGAFVFFEYRAKKRIGKAFGERVAPFLSSSVSDSKRRFKLALRCLALVCFVTALARPQMGMSKQEVKARGVELMIAIDVSNSMLSEDVKPSRLENAKAEVMKLLDMLVGDRVGLIAFAGSPALLSPLTTDVNSLKMFVEGLSTESVATQGTNFSLALDEGKTAFERGGMDSDDNVHVTKVMLLISDGEDLEEGALDKARKMADDGFRIFTIAFGTDRGGPIPVRDERGFLNGYKRDKTGQNIISKVNADFLKELAVIGKGSFHHSTMGGMEARSIKDDLDKLEKKEFASTVETNFDERFQIPLLIGLLIALFDLLLGERNPPGRIWKGRFEVSQQ